MKKTKVRITSTVVTEVEHEEGQLPSMNTHHADIWFKPHEDVMVQDYQDLGYDYFSVEVVGEEKKETPYWKDPAYWMILGCILVTFMAGIFLGLSY